MSRDRNLVMLLGRVGQPVETRSTTNSEVSRFSLATNRSWKNKTSGEWESKVEWHSCVAFGQVAQIAKEKLSTGVTADIEGYLQTETWEQDGIKFKRTDIIVQAIRPLSLRAATDKDLQQQQEENDGTEETELDIPY
jgi:single-strand DNA-binding protein